MLHHVSGTTYRVTSLAFTPYLVLNVILKPTFLPGLFIFYLISLGLFFYFFLIRLLLFYLLSHQENCNFIFFISKLYFLYFLYFHVKRI